MQRVTGVVTGIVRSLDDPESLGRVQLSFPWMADSEPVSNWARIAVPMAGGERGVQFMPEIGDEVLVTFEQGDQNHPYIIGALWNGQEKPPRPEAAKRVIQTVSGHVLEFDDTQGSEKISLLFKGDFPGIVLTQDSILIQFNENSKIELTAGKISIINNTLVEINP